MKFMLLFFFMLYFLFLIGNTSSCNSVEWKVDATKFPLKLNRMFILNMTHSTSVEDCLEMVALVEVLENGKSLQKSMHYFNFMNDLFDKIPGKYFVVERFQFHTGDLQSNVEVKFKESANSKNFRINVFNIANLHNEAKWTLVYEKKIRLFSEELKMVVSSSGRSRKRNSLEFPVGSKVDVVCTDGILQEEPTAAVNMNPILSSVSLMVNRNETSANTAKLQFVTDIASDGAAIFCHGNRTTVHKTIRVFHHSRSVNITQGENKKLRVGDVLECKNTGGGWPIPRVQWRVINSTERNHTSQIRITSSLSGEEAAKLELLSGARAGSTWRVECSAVNTLPHMTDINKDQRSKVMTHRWEGIKRRRVCCADVLGTKLYFIR